MEVILTLKTLKAMKGRKDILMASTGLQTKFPH